MMNETIGKPDTTEYLPYYGKYISLVPDGDILAVLGKQIEETTDLLNSISESRASFRYAPDKWSIKELVGHVIDTERIFAYRALRFARNDKTPLPGYEQDDYVRSAAFDNCTLADLASEFKSVRQSTLFLFKHLDEDAWMRRGLANDAEASVRALAHIIAGHELHHREILRSRYLSATNASGA
jgi:DinB superfamily